MSEGWPLATLAARRLARARYIRGLSQQIDAGAGDGVRMYDAMLMLSVPA